MDGISVIGGILVIDLLDLEDRHVVGLAPAERRCLDAELHLHLPPCDEKKNRVPCASAVARRAHR